MVMEAGNGQMVREPRNGEAGRKRKMVREAGGKPADGEESKKRGEHGEGGRRRTGSW